MDKYERNSEDSQSDISQGILSCNLVEEGSSFHSAHSEPEAFEEPEQKREIGQPAGNKLRIDPEEPREETKFTAKYKIYQRPKNNEEQEEEQNPREEYNPRPTKNRRKPTVKYVKKGEAPIETAEPEDQRPRYRGKERKGRGRRGRGYKQRRQYHDKQNYYERKGNYERRDNYERRENEWRENNKGYIYDKKDNETGQWEKPAAWDNAEPFVPANQTVETPKVILIHSFQRNQQVLQRQDLMLLLVLL